MEAHILFAYTINPLIIDDLRGLNGTFAIDIM